MDWRCPSRRACGAPPGPGTQDEFRLQRPHRPAGTWTSFPGRQVLPEGRRDTEGVPPPTQPSGGPSPAPVATYPRPVPSSGRSPSSGTPAEHRLGSLVQLPADTAYCRPGPSLMYARNIPAGSWPPCPAARSTAWPPCRFPSLLGKVAAVQNCLPQPQVFLDPITRSSSQGDSVRKRCIPRAETPTVGEVLGVAPRPASRPWR